MGKNIQRKRKILRTLAGEAMKTGPEGGKDFTTRDLDYLLEELSRHQTELETQNEELLRAERQIEESSRKYAYLYQFAPVGYFTLDERGLIRKVNMAGSRLIGIKRSVFQGTPFFLVVHEEDKKKFDGYLRSVFRARQERRCELRLLRVRKSPFWAELTSRRFMDDDGGASCLMIVTEISERKRAEHALFQVQSELGALVEARTSELSAARAEAVLEKDRREGIEKRLSEVQEQLGELTSYLYRTGEEEKKGLARHIHDEVGQMLVAVKMGIGWVRQEYGDHVNLEGRMKIIDRAIGTAINSVERIMSDLRPVILDQLGLVHALDWYLDEFRKEHDIECDLVFRTRDINIKGEGATVLFRVLQESLANAVRHAGASRIGVLLERRAGSAVLKVSDNGRGITESQVKDLRSFGIIGMRERVLHCGGKFEIKGARGKGTKITAGVPIGE